MSVAATRRGLVRFLAGRGAVLAIAALAVASVLVLHGSYVRWQRVLEQTAAAINYVSESRRRVIRAYLVDANEVGREAVTSRGWALAELDAAEQALRNWLRGRSGILGIRGHVPQDSTLLALAGRYQAQLDTFRVALRAARPGSLALRNHFSRTENAAGALESAAYAYLRSRVQAEQRRYRILLFAWGGLLLGSGMAALYARAARLAAESNRRRSESRLAQLREITPIGIVECDQGGRICAANRMWAALTGTPEGAWLGRPWWEAFAEPERTHAASWWASTLAGESEHTLELALARPGPEAEASHLLATVSPVAALAGEERRWVATFMDVTQRHLAELQLRHAQKMEAVGRLAGGVAHDFNNLLTSIHGFAELAREGLPPDSRAHADIREIEAAAEHGQRLTRQLLSFARRRRGEREPLDVCAAVTGMRRMLRRLVPPPVELVIEVAPGPARVLAERGQVERVLTNLVVNAADATPPGGRIRVAVTAHADGGGVADGPRVRVTVQDTGTGIPASVQTRMFEPFFTTKEPGKGTGLGLSITWSLVQQLGGAIHVESEPGRGTTFHVDLPVLEDAPD